jgi:hypothetical protein
MGPNNAQNSSLECDFFIYNYEKYCQNLAFTVKTPNLIKKLFFALCQNQERGPQKTNKIISNEETF